MTPSIPYARSNEKLTPIVTICLVFLCGMACGAVLMSIAGHRLVHHTVSANTLPKLPATVDEWKQRLDLSEDQVHQLTSILDDLSSYYDNVLADGSSRITGILNPSQKKKFAQMLADSKRK